MAKHPKIEIPFKTYWKQDEQECKAHVNVPLEIHQVGYPE